MKFHYVTLLVKDLDASLRFYQEIIGLTLRKQFAAGPDTQIVFLGSGETEVELICGKDTGIADCGKGVTLAFTTGSLEDTIALLREKNYETDGVIRKPDPNTSFFYAQDPDGYRIQFVLA